MVYLRVLFFFVVGAHPVLVAVAAVLHGQHHVALLHHAVLGPAAHEVQRQAVGLSFAEGGVGCAVEGRRCLAQSADVAQAVRVIAIAVGGLRPGR